MREEGSATRQVTERALQRASLGIGRTLEARSHGSHQAGRDGRARRGVRVDLRGARRTGDRTAEACAPPGTPDSAPLPRDSQRGPKSDGSRASLHRRSSALRQARHQPPGPRLSASNRRAGRGPVGSHERALHGKVLPAGRTTSRRRILRYPPERVRAASARSRKLPSVTTRSPGFTPSSTCTRSPTAGPRRTARSTNRCSSSEAGT